MKKLDLIKKICLLVLKILDFSPDFICKIDLKNVKLSFINLEDNVSYEIITIHLFKFNIKDLYYIYRRLNDYELYENCYLDFRYFETGLFNFLELK